MGWAKYFEDIQDRFDEASTYLVRYAPAPNQVARSSQEPLQPLPKSGEWQSIRQQIRSLLDELKAELVNFDKRQDELLEILTDPNAALLDKWHKAHQEKGELKQQNEELRRDVLLLQYRLKEAGLWKNSYSSRLAGTSKEPKPASLQSSSSNSGIPTAIEMAMQKARAYKEEYK